MRRFLLSIILICILILPVSAHPGDTDSSGGHYDHETGEYHYHHGYPAHDHYDMDGDGDVDCPYDFDDQTGANSGASSGSALSEDKLLALREARLSSADSQSEFDRGYDLGYDAGYEYAYDRGYAEGVAAERKKQSSVSTSALNNDGRYDEGYADGYDVGYDEGSTAVRAKFFVIAIFAVLVIGFFLAKANMARSSEAADTMEKYRQEILRLRKECDRLTLERDQAQSEIDQVRADCQARMDQTQTACQNRLQELIRSSNTKNIELKHQFEARLSEQSGSAMRDRALLETVKDKEIAALSAKVEECRTALENKQKQHADELRRLEAAARETRLDAFFSHFSPSDFSGIQFPPDVELCGGTVSSGRVSRQKPFGNLTVYTSHNGKCYHMKQGCCGATIPNNRYEMMYLSVPRCSKCSNWRDYLTHCPDWYIRYKEIISCDYIELDEASALTK